MLTTHTCMTVSLFFKVLLQTSLMPTMQRFFSLTASHHHNLLSGSTQSSSPGKLATDLLMSQQPVLSWHRPTSWTWPLTPSCWRRSRRLHFHTLVRLCISPHRRLLLRSLLRGRPLRRSCSCCWSHLQRLEGWCTHVIFDFLDPRCRGDKQEHTWGTQRPRRSGR